MELAEKATEIEVANDAKIPLLTSVVQGSIDFKGCPSIRSKSVVKSPPPSVVVVEGSVDYRGHPSVRSKSGCWRSAFYMIGAEVAERTAFYGLRTNLVSYLTGPMGQSTAMAAVNVNALIGTADLSPLLGAFVGDVLLGQYWTIITSSVFYAFGLGCLFLSVLLHSNCTNSVDNKTCSPSTLQNILFFSSLYIAVLMQGGHRPCLQAFAAQQFDVEDPKESKAKASFFNWWNFAMSVGILFAYTVLNYIQESVSWKIGFGIPFVAMVFSVLVFPVGTGSYRFRLRTEKTRNPFVKIGSVFRKAISFQQTIPKDATISEEAPKNMLCENTQSKVILKLVPFSCTCLGLAIVTAQTPTLFTKQGATMERRVSSSFQIPAASLQSLLTISMIVLLPMYDLIFVPLARAVRQNSVGVTVLQRIGIGQILSILSMVAAGFIERKRLATAIEYGLLDMPNATVPMSIWWLVPQYLLVGSAQCFAYVGLQEFFYDQVPSKLKSLAIALYLSIFGIGNFLSSSLISIIEKATSGSGNDSWFSDNMNRAHLDYFYWLLASISIIAFAAYLYLAKCYVYTTKKVNF